ncbi:ABC transporter ATP-binding protein [Clostridium sp. 'deep sea']|uniref:ABC transporter ATP-binding protein n=1 Tax=Clostridium sp. 'deep sea' TaxID=2779445 RepID=UPI00189683FE|nr:ABC transporter ATP-binding protein [Clostridium sp. 'deep sea']QOR36830.1 ABC transporter ATP-binding protein [Clostridium sp. 'deep sea']
MIYLLKTAWNYSGKDKWKVITYYILHGLSIGGELLKPYAFGRAINALQIYGVNNLKPTIMWLLLYLAGFFQFEVFHRIGQYFVVTVALKNQQRFIKTMYKKVYNLPLQWHVNHHTGDTVSRINVAALALRNFCYEQEVYLKYLILSVGPIVILFTLSWQIAVISLILTAINLVIIEAMNKAIQKIMYRQTEKQHLYSAKLVDFISNIKTIVSLKLLKTTAAELNSKFQNYYQECLNEFKINQPRCFIMGFGLIVTELIIIAYFLWSHKIYKVPIMVGSLVMIVNYYRQLSKSFFDFACSFYDTLRWKTALLSVKDIEDTAKKTSEKQANNGLVEWHKLKINKLNFSYNAKPALKDVNITLNKTSKVAIVGKSGSGKSTLLQVLAGFYKPLKVNLQIDNKEALISNITTNTILTSQDAELFENTVLYNITFALQTNNKELKQIIKIAQLQEVINKLPKGLNTSLAEKGLNLSGGEKQRIALARALFFAKNKQILLLDEVTSNIDAHNEKLIIQQILKHFNNNCVIFTLHRLHLLNMFDEIIVMDNGRIVEQGSLKELIKLNGYFNLLWQQYLLSGGE